MHVRATRMGLLMTVDWQSFCDKAWLHYPIFNKLNERFLSEKWVSAAAICNSNSATGNAYFSHPLFHSQMAHSKICMKELQLVAGPPAKNCLSIIVWMQGATTDQQHCSTRTSSRYRLVQFDGAIENLASLATSRAGHVLDLQHRNVNTLDINTIKRCCKYLMLKMQPGPLAFSSLQEFQNWSDP